MSIDTKEIDVNDLVEQTVLSFPLIQAGEGGYFVLELSHTFLRQREVTALVHLIEGHQLQAIHGVCSGLLAKIEKRVWHFVQVVKLLLRKVQRCDKAVSGDVNFAVVVILEQSADTSFITRAVWQRILKALKLRVVGMVMKVLRFDFWVC